jgi:MFS family permease
MPLSGPETTDGATAPNLSHTNAYNKQVGSRYSWYVLVLLVIVYFVNFVDRQIISILAEDIKKDLGVSDAQIGFLYGTAFAIFYSLFGIPLGRLADMWVRTRLMAIGLAVWSGLTAISGFTANFAQLALVRVGIGIGEASASPSAFSLLSDYFPKQKRATVLAIYSAGLYLGGGFSYLLGSLVVDGWNSAFPDHNFAPFGLAGWQAAFVGVGLPGILLAVFVWTIREPVRGLADGIITPPATDIWRKFWLELSAILPPFTLIHLFVIGGMKSLVRNILLLIAVCVAVVVMFFITKDIAQWIALGIGVYAVTSWAQSLYIRDRPTFALTWGTAAFRYAVTAFGLISFAGYSVGFWLVPYLMREFSISKKTAALTVGVPHALAGLLGVILGGYLADKLKSRGPAGRLVVAFAACVGPMPFYYYVFTGNHLPTIYIVSFLGAIIGSCWVGVGAATTQDLVLPRMRGTAGATYFVGTTMLGLALGPYYTGAVSKATGSLAVGALALYLIAPLTLFCLWRLRVLLPEAEASRTERARAVGEDI